MIATSPARALAPRTALSLLVAGGCIVASILATQQGSASAVTSYRDAGAAPASGAAPARTSSTGAPSATAPFSLVFQAPFSGTAPDPRYWSIFHGPGNGTNGPKALANTFVSNGYLVLRAAPINGTWYGAGVCACGVVQTYGKYEMMVRFDAGYGIKTAAMLWPANGGWPPEVDFYEISEADPTRSTNVLTNHWRDATGTHMEHGLSRGNFTQWHVVGLEWTPGALNFTLDGVVVKTMTSNVPKVPMWFGMNVSLGPPGVRPNTSTPSHVDADIDWVKIYKYTG